jgi:hypothetical protein
MLERLQEGPNRIVGLRATGAVTARNVEEAIGSIEEPGPSVAVGLVIVADRDFDGNFAELAQGLTSAAIACRSLVRLALVTEPEELEEARTRGFDREPVPVRLFAAADLRAALDWAAAAPRGE